MTGGNGVNKDFPNEGCVICDDCKGSGEKDCFWCSGHGKVLVTNPDQPERYEHCSKCNAGMVDCKTCGGFGEIDDEV